MFDGSSIEGFVRIEESDMYLHPDLDTFVIFPWRTSEDHKVARLICDVYCSDGTPFEGDPRYVLRRAIKKAADMGYSCNVGPECEFFPVPYRRKTESPPLRLTTRAVISTSAPLTAARTAAVTSASHSRRWALKSKRPTMRSPRLSMR